MRVLGILGIALTVLIIGAGLYAYLGFYDVAASNPHTDAVRWSLEEIQDNTISRRKTLSKSDSASAVQEREPPRNQTCHCDPKGKANGHGHGYADQIVNDHPGVGLGW